MSALMPFTGLAASAWWMAAARGLCGGTGPPLVAASAIAVPPPIAATAPASTASTRRMGAVRRNLLTICHFLSDSSVALTVGHEPEITLTDGRSRPGGAARRPPRLDRRHAPAPPTAGTPPARPAGTPGAARRHPRRRGPPPA